MNTLGKIKQKIDGVRQWFRSRKVRRVRRAVGAAADTAAAGVGFTLRLGLKILLTALLVFITTGMILACIFAVYVKTSLYKQLDVTPQELARAESSHILAETSPGSGQWTELATLHYDINRIPVEYDQIPKDLEHACVAIEDRRFYQHKGVDWWRTVGAFGNMFLSMRDSFGGSTITQQLIKNLTGKDEVTVQRKLLEIFQALDFEKKYTKEEIITWYMNQIFLGEGCYGVGAAARAYFGKEVWQLDLAECASLIGITNNPSKYDPYISEDTKANNKERQENILWQMYDQGYITYEQYDSAKNETLHFRSSVGEDRSTEPFTYYEDSLIWDLVEDMAEARGVTEDVAEALIYNGGYKIYSCMDMRIQQIVDEIYQNVGGLPRPWQNPHGAKLSSAIVIIDPSDGAIVALAGDTGVKEGSFTDNYATRLPRPPGSSFKPVAVYGPALDLGLITQSTKVNDAPNIVLKNSPNWYPYNDGMVYSGWTTIRDALIRSRNTVAAQILDKMGRQASWDYLTNRFGFTSLIWEEVDKDTGRVISDYVYPALALGQLSRGVTAREMAQAYTAFANNGVMSFGRTYSLVLDRDDNVILDNPARQQVAVKENTAWNIADMLQAAVASGTGSPAYFGSTAVAGKTGTTSSARDRYFTGFTRYYVAAVWTGYKMNYQMYFSSNPASIIWKTVMQRVHAGLPYASFPSPYIGYDTGLFGDEATESPEPTEEATPSPTQEAPPPTGEEPPTGEAPPTAPPAETDPPVTIQPVVTDPPPATDPPTAPPVTAEPVTPAEPTKEPPPVAD